MDPEIRALIQTSIAFQDLRLESPQASSSLVQNIKVE